MSRRAARVTQCDIERALRAASAQRSRSGEAWRVRVEVDGVIILEPQPKAAGGDDWPTGEAGPAFGERRRFVL
ncbi:hypothetical protein [Methylocystis sp. SC2]|uniref:hypothetical protein n=1 Tax=Methylocystis sp. (strain SC2) TaxID=187303 RepID=UPI00027AEF31|nr:hypothetical protein [Methylocystis sp. SC2]CCJ07031.1 Hypothetical protein BN69_1580 [Methylocystis sp. SC2]